jgi:hypothetical protein
MSNFGNTLFNGSGCCMLRLLHSQSTTYTMFQFALIQFVSVQGVACACFTCTWDAAIIIIYFNVVWQTNFLWFILLLTYIFISCAFYKWLLFKKLLVLVWTWAGRWYRLENWRAMVLIPGRGKRFFCPVNHTDWVWGAHSSLPSGYWWILNEAKVARHGRLVPRLKISKTVLSLCRMPLWNVQRQWYILLQW